MPTRRIIAGALVATAVLVPVGILAANAIEHAKDVAAREQRRRDAARLAVERRRLAADQRPHTLVVPVPAHRLRPVTARAAFVKDLEQAITADARRRARSHLLDAPVSYTLCEHSDIASEASLQAVFARYRCTAVTSTNRSVRGYPFVTGYTFFGTIRFRERRLIWCKFNPRPGEQASRAGVLVKPAFACAGPLRDIL